MTMRLIVTRPEPDAAATAARLRAAGHDVLVAPLLHMTPCPEPAPVPAVQAAAFTSRNAAAWTAAFTSRNAARAVAGWDAAASWRKLPVFAIGESTASVLREDRFMHVAAGGGDGVALAELVIARVKPEGGPIAFPTTAVRSDGFEARLREAGFDVRPIEAYRIAEAESFPPEVAQSLAAGTAEGVLVYSERTAHTFARLAIRSGFGKALEATVFFVLSRRVGEALGQIRPSRVVISAAPDEDHLIQALAESAAAR